MTRNWNRLVMIGPFIRVAPPARSVNCSPTAPHFCTFPLYCFFIIYPIFLPKHISRRLVPTIRGWAPEMRQGRWWRCVSFATTLRICCRRLGKVCSGGFFSVQPQVSWWTCYYKLEVWFMVGIIYIDVPVVNGALYTPTYSCGAPTVGLPHSPQRWDWSIIFTLPIPLDFKYQNPVGM